MSMASRYAIFSDIHGNLRALKAALALAREYGAERLCCLGDTVGYGANSASCLKLVRDAFTHVVQGNHDAQIRANRDPAMRPEAVASLDYALAALDAKEVDWLETLPHPLLVDNQFFLAHGALAGRDAYILKQEDANQNLRLLAESQAPAPVLFFGHTHLPMALTATGARTDWREGGALTLQPEKAYLINPGSVGQPRDGNPAACFCLYDPEDAQVVYLRAEYDVAAEQDEMRRAGLAEKSITRLAFGR